MGEYKTPGVYIKEKNAFGNSVVEAETAIPVFIGLTEKAKDGATSLLNKPVRISSMTEYNKYFGGAPLPEFIPSVEDITEEDDKKYLCCFHDRDKKKALKIKSPDIIHTLYYHLVLFFANGGGTCYIVSMGGYDKSLSDVYTKESKEAVFANIKKEQDITMLVIPEAVNAKATDCMNIYTGLLTGLCESKKYFAILDVPVSEEGDDVELFRTGIGTAYLQFAAAYYPWLETSVLSDNDISQERYISTLDHPPP